MTEKHTMRNQRPIWLWLVLVLCALPMGLSAQALPIGDISSGIYSNDHVGVQVDLGSQWQLYTSRADAPAAMQPSFPLDKGPDDSPLFIGVHQSETLFSRLLVEPFFDDLQAYAEQMLPRLAEQGLELQRARMLPDATALEVEYTHEALGLYFIERISRLEDSQVLRMAVWVQDSAREQFASEILAVFDHSQVRGVLGAPTGYQPVWVQLAARLPDENLPGLVTQRGAAESITAEVCADPGASMLWQVQGSELDSQGMTLHLFGSIHVGKREFYPLHPSIENHFRSADNLVFEIDPQAAADPQQALQMQLRGMLPAGQTLPDVISAATLTDLQSVVASLGLPLEGFMTMKPWLLTLMLTNFQANTLGYNAEFGLESYFAREKSPQSQVRELESLQQQVGMLDSLDPEMFLGYSLREFAASAAEMENMVHAWRCGDQDALTVTLFPDLDDGSLDAAEQTAMDDLHQKLFTDRNQHMAAGIENFIRTGSGSWFVVLGAGHLLGEGSVVELLQQRGYRVTPVRLE